MASYIAVKLALCSITTKYHMYDS